MVVIQADRSDTKLARLARDSRPRRAIQNFLPIFDHLYLNPLIYRAPNRAFYVRN
jgi:hypothetical protein